MLADYCDSVLTVIHLGSGRGYIDLGVGEVVLDILPDAWEIEEVSMVPESVAEFKGRSFLEVLGRNCQKRLSVREVSQWLRHCTQGEDNLHG